jgi:hypothetical protein
MIGIARQLHRFVPARWAVVVTNEPVARRSMD